MPDKSESDSEYNSSDEEVSFLNILVLKTYIFRNLHCNLAISRVDTATRSFCKRTVKARTEHCERKEERM